VGPSLRGAVFVRGRSLSAGARCSWVGSRRRPFALEDGGGGRSFRAVVRGWSWWGYGRGRAMVSGGGSGRSRVGVLLFVGGGSGSSALGCCLLAPGYRCSWVGDGRSWVADERSWVGDGGGGGVMVELCGRGVMVELCGGGVVRRRGARGHVCMAPSPLPFFASHPRCPSSRRRCCRSCRRRCSWGSSPLTWHARMDR
jgi:hypothetical protein